MQVEYRFNCLPPSVNKIYATNFITKRRFKTAEASQWQAYVQTVVDNPFSFPVGRLVVEVELHGSWLTQTGKPRKKDLDNHVKSLLDAVFKAVEVDDSLVWSLFVQKIESVKEQTVIRICPNDEH